jgi:hypothetical protein
MKYLEVRLSRLLSMTSINILACDVSYRHTGVCILNKSESRNSLLHTECLDNPQIKYGFEGYRFMAINMQDKVKKIKQLYEEYNGSIIVCEMPTYGRSMNAGMAIGICWGAMPMSPLIIPPSHLKDWSDSNKGDAKIKVKEKVMSRIHLDSYSNDNIVDAVGTALMISDLITILKHEANK